jgi:hypothetical protein
MKFSDGGARSSWAEDCNSTSMVPNYPPPKQRVAGNSSPAAQRFLPTACLRTAPPTTNDSKHSRRYVIY